MNDMKLSDRGLELIAAFEGCVLELYNDPVGLATIGYGHLVHKGRVGTNPQAEAPFKGGLTKETALRLLREDVARFEKAVNQAVTVQLAQNEFDALVSLAFNIGAGAFAKSTLVRVINAGTSNQATITAAFAMWNKAGGKVHKGLVGRRDSEAKHFLGS